MTKHEMMVKAHGLAKQMVGNYSARLALALRQLWAALKLEVKKGMKKVYELEISGCRVFVDTETREVSCNTYGCKEALRKRFDCKWNPRNKTWEIPERTREQIRYEMMDKMLHLIEEFAI